MSGLDDVNTLFEMPRYLTGMFVVMAVRHLLCIIVGFPADTHQFLTQPGLSFEGCFRVSNQRIGHIYTVIIGAVDVVDIHSELSETRLGLGPRILGAPFNILRHRKAQRFHRQLNFH